MVHVHGGNLYGKRIQNMKTCMDDVVMYAACKNVILSKQIFFLFHIKIISFLVNECFFF